MLSNPFYTCQQPYSAVENIRSILAPKYMGLSCGSSWVHWKHYLLLLLMILSAACAKGKIVKYFNSLCACTSVLQVIELYFTVTGRVLIVENGVVVEEEKILLRGRTSSRPPACERRCGRCSRCEPVQVPAMPQAKERHSSMVPTMNTREEGRSNYKPVNWKCKCGDKIFNP